MTAQSTSLNTPNEETPHALQFNHDDWIAWASEYKIKPFRIKQIHQWIYDHGVFNPDEMTNVSESMREMLKNSFDWSLPKIIQQIESKDLSTKLLLEAPGSLISECVIMRYPERTTLCLSSQVGCKLACTFCQTGKLGFVRHLPGWYILAQFYLAMQICKAEGRRLSHVVFMGMGEPFDNYANSVFAANRMIDEDYFNLSKRHVTVSTSGLVPQIEKFTFESEAALAISLHAANDELRSSLMPINRKYNLERLKKSLIEYQAHTNRKITIEYILIEGVNTGLTDAKQLVKFLHGLKVKVNLIPFNEHPGIEFEKASSMSIRSFQKYLSDRSIPAPVRYSRGEDVSAACGQLAAKEKQDLFSKPDRKRVFGPKLEN